MAKTWLANKVEVYFDDLENEKTVKKSFQNIVENPTDIQVKAFADAVSGLYRLDKSYTVITESHKVD